MKESILPLLNPSKKMSSNFLAIQLVSNRLFCMIILLIDMKMDDCLRTLDEIQILSLSLKLILKDLF